METRANYVLIGLFTLAALLGSFAFVFWFQHVSTTGDRIVYRILFEGPASGLRSGSAVMFNGIRVGEVASVGLDDPQRVAALVSIERSTPIREDTRVGLDFQGLTGIASVALRGGTVDAKPVTAVDGQLPTLRADSMSLQDVTEAARTTLRQIDGLISDNRETLRNTVRNLETFSATLAKNSERIDSILAGIETLTGGKEGNGELQSAVRSIRELAQNLDKRTAALVTDGRKTLVDIDRAVRNFDRNPQRLIFGGPSVFGGKPSGGR